MRKPLGDWNADQTFLVSRRLRGVPTNSDSATTTLSIGTIYLHDGENVVEEVDNSGNVLARYTQTRTLDEQLLELRSGVTSYYEADGLGRVTSLPSAALVEL